MRGLLRSLLFKSNGSWFWPVWTVGYWAVAWFAVLTRLTGITETICLVCSWPSYAIIFFPSGVYDATFFMCVPIFLGLFIFYWIRLLRFVASGRVTLITGCLFHLCGGVGLVRMYNESHDGIPFQLFFHETLWGIALTAGYILGFGIIIQLARRAKTSRS